MSVPLAAVRSNLLECCVRFSRSENCVSGFVHLTLGVKSVLGEREIIRGCVSDFPNFVKLVNIHFNCPSLETMKSIIIILYMLSAQNESLLLIVELNNDGSLELQGFRFLHQKLCRHIKVLQALRYRGM